MHGNGSTQETPNLIDFLQEKADKEENMTHLSFSLLPSALIRLHDTLICLAKFNESVALEAEYDLLRLSVLNSTKTAYSAFVFEADSFFENYSFSPNTASSSSGRSNRFCFQVYLKALLSVFKGRTSDKDKDTAVERCEVEIHEDAQQTECRLVIRMICGLGVIKSYKLTYEPVHVQHAIFDRSRTENQWTIEPRFLREIADHFSPSAEQLDIYSEGDKAVFTSFTTKITEGKEILKQPVHTSVAIDKRDFDDFLAQDNQHIAINIKDFKAVIAHAETADAVLTARYTRPCRPLQLAYESEGVKSEFTLMTRGEASNENDALNSSRDSARQSLARQTQPPTQVSRDARRLPGNNNRQRPMPPPAAAPPAATARRDRPVRPLTGTPSASRDVGSNTQNERPPAASMDFDSLFVPADDDRQWDVPNDDEDAQEDVLGWDATGDQEASLGPRLQESGSHTLRPLDEQAEQEQDADMGIPPTQRMSQLHGLGLFD